MNMQAGRRILPDVYAASESKIIKTVRTKNNNDSAGKNKGP
jgi:hypothetical protein